MNDFFLMVHAEFLGYGSRLLLPLVRRLGGGKNFRPDCVSTVSEGHVYIGSKVLHRVPRSVCFGKKNIYVYHDKNFEEERELSRFFLNFIWFAENCANEIDSKFSLP